MSSHEFFDFAHPWDGTQPELSIAERLETGLQFTAFFDGFLETHAANVNRFHDEMTGDYEALHMTLPAGDERLDIFVESHRDTYGKFGADVKKIVLQAVVDEQVDSMIAYHYVDGMVRRQDDRDPDVRQARMEMEGLDEDLTNADIEDIVKNLVQDLPNYMANMDTEMEMGLQMQPIGLYELHSLQELLTRPDIIVQPRQA